jgi:hypothetical protein
MATWRPGFVHPWFIFFKPVDGSTVHVQLASQFQSQFPCNCRYVILLVVPLFTIIRVRYFVHKDTNMSV